MSFSELPVCGRGSFGVVRVDDDTGIATKKVLLRTSFEASKSQPPPEAKIMLQLKHPNIIELVSFRIEGWYLYLSMPYCGGGSLFDIWKGGTKVQEQQVKGWILSGLNGLAYLEKKRIIHRDIKPGNLLLTDNGTLKIIDFGLAIVKSENKVLPAGTPKYWSAECFRHDPEFDHPQIFLFYVGDVYPVCRKSLARWVWIEMEECWTIKPSLWQRNA